MEKKPYFFTETGMIDGAYREVNEPVSLTDRQAKYLLMAGLISTERVVVQKAPPKAEPSPVDLDMKVRKN